MFLERIILISIWILTAFLIFITTPRKKIREALVIFMFKQLITWFFGLLVVEYKLVEYPVREFRYATASSFSFEYFIYPAITVVFILRFPENKTFMHKLMWYMFFPTWMTLAEVLLEKYTDLIRYINWEWYWTWISLLITFYISQKFYIWFVKKGTGCSDISS